MCVTELHRRGVKFTPLGDTGSANCPIKTAVKITTFKNALPSSAFVLSCTTALNLDDWLTANRIKKFAHMGTINCRKMREKGLQSEHSEGTAIDISTVDGASVQEDWGKDSSKRKKLKKSCHVHASIFQMSSHQIQTHYIKTISILIMVLEQVWRQITV